MLTEKDYKVIEKAAIYRPAAHFCELRQGKLHPR